MLLLFFPIGSVTIHYLLQCNPLFLIEEGVLVEGDEDIGGSGESLQVLGVVGGSRESSDSACRCIELIRPIQRQRTVRRDGVEVDKEVL